MKLKKSEKLLPVRRIISDLTGAGPKNNFSAVSDPLASAFLLLLNLLHRETHPFDVASYNEADDKLAFLQQSQRVFAGWFTLADDWYLQETNAFIATDRQTNAPLIVFRKDNRKYYLNPVKNEAEPVTVLNKDRILPQGLFIYGDTCSVSVKQLILRMVRNNIPGLIKYILLMVLSGAGVGGVIFLIKLIPEMQIMIQGKPGFGLLLSALFLIVAVALTNILANVTRARFQTKVRAQQIPDVICNLMQLRPREKNALSEELLGTFLPYIEAIDTAAGAFLSMVTYVLYIAFIILITAQINLPLSKRILFPALVFSSVSVLLFVIMYRAAIKKWNAGESLSLMRKEMLDNISSIKNEGIEENIYNRLMVAFQEYTLNRVRFVSIGQTLSALVTLLNSIGILLIFYGSVLHTEIRVDVSAVNICIAVMGLVVSYLSNLIMVTVQFMDSLPQLALGNHILSAKAEGTAYGHIIPDVKGGIECSELVFSYDRGGRTILRKISFSVQPGESLAIVGNSGSGKSTLLKLLIGFETPDNGTVLIDGIDLKLINPGAYRKQLGVVLQNDGLVNGSVLTNIGMDENADPEAVRHAARLACIEDDIEAMPMKYNTFLSSESDLVSGGQKQRIILARALMGNPKILLLDEATSALDNITEKRVMENLNELNITRIFVTHRLSTITGCDRIIVLKDGKIEETGTYGELMEKNGYFVKMVQRNLV